MICWNFHAEFDGNMAKGGIWKCVLQENKVHQIFRKTNILSYENLSYPLLRTGSNHTEWSNTLRQSVAGELFEYVWPFCGVGASTYQGLKNNCFWKIWRVCFFCNTRFDIRPFALLLTNYEWYNRDSFFSHPIIVTLEW